MKNQIFCPTLSGSYDQYEVPQKMTDIILAESDTDFKETSVDNEQDQIDPSLTMAHVEPAAT